MVARLEKGNPRREEAMNQREGINGTRRKKKIERVGSAFRDLRQGFSVGRKPSYAFCLMRLGCVGERERWRLTIDAKVFFQ